MTCLFYGIFGTAKRMGKGIFEYLPPSYINKCTGSQDYKNEQLSTQRLGFMSEWVLGWAEKTDTSISHDHFPAVFVPKDLI